MSGTQENNSPVQNFQNQAQEVQSGTEHFSNETQEASTILDSNKEKKLTPSERMDRLIRGSSSGYIKKELEKLRKEAAKYRNFAKEEESQKLELQEKAFKIQNELNSLKTEHRKLSIMRKLDNSGCIKSELVTKDIPADLDITKDLDSFIEKYKEENEFLFKQQKASSIGGTFKTSCAKNLSPSQKMDAYIRAALGR